MFRRYEPYGDGREVIGRSGEARTAPQGFPRGVRSLSLGGRELRLTTYQSLLSPPPMRPGQEPMSREAAAEYTPDYEWVDLPNEQLTFRRGSRGFTTEEVDALVAAILARDAAA